MRSYLLSCAVAFAGFLVIVFGLNVWVDPYRIWNVPGGYSEANARPRAIQQVTVLKMRGIARTRPATLVLGSSRTEIGLDPQSLQWPDQARPVFNASIPGAVGRGAGLYAAVEALEQPGTEGIRYAVIGLDFLDFLVDADHPLPPRTPLMAAGESTRWQRLLEDLRLGLSLDALLDSLVTLYERNDHYAVDIRSDGFNPVHDYDLMAMQEGYGALFLQRDSENARSYAHLPKSVFEKSTQTSESWKALERLIEIGRTRRIEIRFIVYPYHAHILEMLQGARLIPAFEAWKKRLATIIQDGTRSEACPLWDFSGYHVFAREPVPPPGDRTTVVQWYWESGHFKRELGERMLARMFHGTGDDDFGVCLTPASVYGQNLRLRRDREHYRSEAPQEVAAIAELMRKQSGNRRPGSATGDSE